MVCEKYNGRIDRFSPQDVEENLVVYVMMLQAASREIKDDLRIFMDSGGFQAFFPPDDRLDRHAKLLERFRNLDTFNDGPVKQIKTSLGNVLRILTPVVILDESIERLVGREVAIVAEAAGPALEAAAALLLLRIVTVVITLRVMIAR